MPGLPPAPLPLPAPLGGREAYIEQIARMLASAKAKILIGPASMAAWLPEIAAKTPLSFAGVLADLPEAAGADPADHRAGPHLLPAVLVGQHALPDRRAGHPPRPDGQRRGHHPRRPEGSPRRPRHFVAAALSRHGSDRVPAQPHDQPDVGRPAADRAPSCVGR
jgi:hypothetical protein